MAPHTTADGAGERTYWASSTSLRTAFTLAMSAMYKREVPLYGDLVNIVNDVNASPTSALLDPKVRALRYGTRLDIERHGAIRLGTALELKTIRRVFALIGMEPVGYYDLSEAGLPMHATCFRPTPAAALEENPFRVFTSVLRLELLEDAKVKDLATDLLSRRNIFSDELLRLLDLADEQGGKLSRSQGARFVPEAVKTFGWHDTAAATRDEYDALAGEHPILADIACFRTAHINHLTPRTLDIAKAQQEMQCRGLAIKDRIEGPPARKCPILLRQTSFLAIEEPINFPLDGRGVIEGKHRARFGEIEERGAAVTARGRDLYDVLLATAMRTAQSEGEPVKPERLDELVARCFDQYPDDWTELRKQGLVYYSVQPTSKSATVTLEGKGFALDKLVEEGLVQVEPITYEDFLPLSAAGIFQSNLGACSGPRYGEARPDVEGIEAAMGVKLKSPDELYERIQAESIADCSSKLGVDIHV